jgi:predicted nucleic acid-binding protein
VQLWSEADEVVSAGIVAIEARAAVARRLRGVAATGARRQLSVRLSGMALLHLDRVLTAKAASVADRYRLRALDAVHLAAALEVRDSSLVFATWDAEVREAAARAGLVTAL